MIDLFAFIIFICSACIALASEREFGHPLFRTFTAHDYGEGWFGAPERSLRVTILFRLKLKTALFPHSV
jgi:hypothetical protein